MLTKTNKQQTRNALNIAHLISVVLFLLIFIVAFIIK